MVSVREKSQAAAVLVAAASEEAAAATTAAASVASSTAVRQRAGGGVGRAALRRRAPGRAIGRPVAPSRRQAELGAELVEHRLRRAVRLQRLGEVEADPQRVEPRAFEIEGSQIHADELPGDVAREAFGKRLLEGRGNVMLPIGLAISGAHSRREA